MRLREKVTYQKVRTLLALRGACAVVCLRGCLPVACTRSWAPDPPQAGALSDQHVHPCGRASQLNRAAHIPPPPCMQEQMLQHKGTIRELERSLSEFQRSTLSQVSRRREILCAPRLFVIMGATPVCVRPFPYKRLTHGSYGHLTGLWLLLCEPRKLSRTCACVCGGADRRGPAVQCRGLHAARADDVMIMCCPAAQQL